MKKYCFNYEDCGWVEYISEEDLSEIDLKNIFLECPECKNLAAIVKNDFNLNRFETEQEEITVTIKREKE